MTGWTEGMASLVGPAVVGALLAWRGPGLAVSATAVMMVFASILAVTVVGPEAARPSDLSVAAAPSFERARAVGELGTRRDLRRHRG